MLSQCLMYNFHNNNCFPECIVFWILIQHIRSKLDIRVPNNLHTQHHIYNNLWVVECGFNTGWFIISLEFRETYCIFKSITSSFLLLKVVFLFVTSCWLIWTKYSDTCETCLVYTNNGYAVNTTFFIIRKEFTLDNTVQQCNTFWWS